MAGKCFVEKDSGLIVDSVGGRILTKSVIVCKQKAFIITEDGDINRFSGEGMDVIYQATEEDTQFLGNLSKRTGH